MEQPDEENSGKKKDRDPCISQKQRKQYENTVVNIDKSYGLIKVVRAWNAEAGQSFSLRPAWFTE